MSWTFKVADWTFEMDLAGLTVTPPETAGPLHRETAPSAEVPPPFEAAESPTLDNGESQAWA